MTLSAQDQPLVRGREVDPHSITSFAGWFPVAVDTEAACAWWRFMGERRFTRAFFQDDLATQPSSERLVCRTSVAALPGIADGLDSVEPTAFVFHVSRCGSTLLTQMLAALPQNIVISEPPVLDGFFRLHHAHPRRSGSAETLRALVSALGQRSLAPGSRDKPPHFFVKFDSWHMPWLGWLRELYPDVPIVMLYRQPGEVLASHRRQPGWQMVPGLLVLPCLALDLDGIAVADLEGYAGRVLGAVFASAWEAVDAGSAVAVNYSQLPEVAWTELLPQWRMALEAEDMATLRTRAGFHSKQAGASFGGDATPTRPAPMPEALSRLYGQLEKKRLAL